MDVAARLRDQRAEEGTVVLADWQYAGRGRFARPWVAPPGGALLMSVLLRPSLGPAVAAQIPLALGLAAVRSLTRLLSDALRPALKWPNDLEVAGGKLGGLLAETSSCGGAIEAVIAGLGVNVAAPLGELPPGAISLAALGLIGVDRGELAAAILAEASDLYERLCSGASLVPEWAQWLSTIGQRVTAQVAGGEVVSGRAIGVSEEGALLLELDGGGTLQLCAGDVTVAPSADRPRPALRPAGRETA